MSRARVFPSARIGEDPLGRHLRLIEDNDNKSYEIVGVVGKTRWLASEPPMPTFYVPLLNGVSSGVLAIRGNSGVDVESLAVPIQKIFGQMDPDLPVSDVLTMRQNIGVATLQDQFNSILILVFAIIALVLAADGLTPVLIGLVVGLAGGAAIVQLLRTMLYGMSPFDWSVFSAVVIVLAITAACACILPAWRASQLDPAHALRTE